MIAPEDPAPSAVTEAFPCIKKSTVLLTDIAAPPVFATVRLPPVLLFIEKFPIPVASAYLELILVVTVFDPTSVIVQP